MFDHENCRNVPPTTVLINLFLCVVIIVGAGVCFADDDVTWEILLPSSEEAEQLEEKREAAQQEKRMADEEVSIPADETLPANIVLPEDTTALLDISSIEITGNSLVSTEELLKNVPLVYNASFEKIETVDPVFLYDFRSIKKVLDLPGQKHQVSARTIQGLTQYLLRVYQKKGHGGVYIYVPAEAFSEGLELESGTLVIRVLEATVGKVESQYFGADGAAAEYFYLKPHLVEEWSPVKSGDSINQKDLDDFLNLLNLNPDRYISATVSKGEEADTLDVGYSIYEVSPWHSFIHIDNAGTKDRRWSPRIGFINTNLTGRDDKLTAVIQGPVDDRFSKHDYSAFASYDVPLFSPKLRLNLFAGRSEFDVNGGQGINFLGNGTVWGGKLKYNLLQHKGWFFDIYSGLSFEKSKVTSSLFPTFFGSEVEMDLWSVGAEMHKSDDMSSTALKIDRTDRIGGSHQDKYWNAATATGARTSADSNFWIWTLSADHFQYLKADKVERVLAKAKYIRPNRRLIPAKMTTFGGMYTVRGYEESAVVADGGVLASFQYEYDLVKAHQVDLARENMPREDKPNLRKLAPLVFFDYGRADNRNHVTGEMSQQELYSVGTGMLFEWGDNLSGGAYYGYPLKKAEGTRTGDGRVNVYLMLKW